jgi:hypothetical protein
MGTKILINEDNFEFKYTRENIYVSRACGFKTVFNLDQSNPFTHTDSTPADQKWARYVIAEKINITSENETIIKIFF